MADTCFNFISSVGSHTPEFADILILQELIRHFDNVSDEIKDIRDKEEVLLAILMMETLLIDEM